MIRDVILKRIESFQKHTYSNVSIQRNVRDPLYPRSGGVWFDQNAVLPFFILSSRMINYFSNTFAAVAYGDPGTARGSFVVQAFEQQFFSSHGLCSPLIRVDKGKSLGQTKALLTAR